MPSHEHALESHAAMLIRRPAREVFDAFVDPATTTRFWFTDSTGPLADEARVRWTWSMYGAHADVMVHAFEPGKRLAIDWGDANGMTCVSWTFDARGDDTFVDVRESGFDGTHEELIAKALDSAGGFALVLAGLKALLEHGIELNLVRDRFPDGHVSS